MTKSIVYTVTVKGDSQEWRLGDKYHREDGPAIIGDNHQAWFLNGKRHREDGPAIIKGDYVEYWIDGKRFKKNVGIDLMSVKFLQELYLFKIAVFNW